MANKRDSTSQKRARENRARREALEVRTKGAPARPSRVAPKTVEKLARTADTKASGTDAKADSASSKAGKTGSGKPRRERPPKPGDRPVDVATLEGSWLSRMMQVPGGTQVLFAGVMAIVATGLMAFSKLFIAEEDAGKKGAKATETIFQAYDLKLAIPLLVVPLLVAGLGVAFSFHPQRRRIWFAAAFTLGMLAASALQFYLFVAGFFGYAVYRAYKVEGPNESFFSLLRRRFGRPSEVPADNGEN